MEFNGLPLHPLAVHGAVVLAPLAALLALAYLVPKWRDKVRWPMVVGGVVAAATVVVAYLSGDSFREANEFFNTPPSEVTEKIDEHEDLGTYLLWWTLAFGALAVLNGVLHPAQGWQRLLLGVLLAGSALVVLLLVFVTGESGARAVWDGFAG